MENLAADFQGNYFIRLYNKVILSHPWRVIFLLLLIAAFFGFYAKDYKVDASADSLVLEGDEDLEFYRQVIKRYASQEYLVVAYQPRAGLLDDETLTALKNLADELGSVEGVASVLSILDVPLLYSPKVSISSLSDGISTLRTNQVDKTLVSAEFRNSPVYRELLSSLDGDTTALQVNLVRDQRYVSLLEAREVLRAGNLAGELDAAGLRELASAEQAFKDYSTQATEQQRVLVADIRSILDKHRDAAATIFLGGVPMIANDMVAFVQSDLQVFGLGILVFIILLLSVIFRSPRWVLLPLLACLLTNTIMLGLLGWLDWRMTVISSNFVALLLIVTLAIAVHLIVRFRELWSQHARRPRRELVLATVYLMIRPCVYTALTTIIAFMSLVVSGIRPIIDFGWMMTVGILVALLLTFIIVPIGMLFGSDNHSDSSSEKAIDNKNEERPAFTLRFASITERYGIVIVVVAAALALFALTGVQRLKVENRFIDYFDESTEIYQGMELIDRKLGGTIPLDILLTHKPEPADTIAVADDAFADDDFFEDDFADDSFGDDLAEDAEPQSYWFTRAGLEEIESIHQYVDSLDETGKVLSLATIFQLAKDLLGGNVDDIQLSFAQRGLPDGIKDILINPYLTPELGETKITVRVKETSRTLNRAELLNNLHDYMQNEKGYASDEYRFTGMLVLYNNMLQSLFKSQILTLGMVFFAITIMLMVLFRSVSLALLGIVPNMLAALIVLGGMGWAGLPLDMMTITIAAISIGIGVDNTIHYVHRFKMEFPVDRNYIKTMYRCHGSIGRALYYTSITIIFGFSILALSNFKPSIYFGLLTGVAMLSAIMGALLLLPRLLIMFKPLGSELVQDAS